MGYEELTKLFRRIDDENSPEYSKYTGLVRKFPVESNAFAQEKALEATLAFAECASAASKLVPTLGCQACRLNVPLAMIIGFARR